MWVVQDTSKMILLLSRRFSNLLYKLSRLTAFSHTHDSIMSNTTQNVRLISNETVSIANQIVVFTKSLETCQLLWHPILTHTQLLLLTTVSRRIKQILNCSEHYLKKSKREAKKIETFSPWFSCTIWRVSDLSRSGKFKTYLTVVPHDKCFSAVILSPISYQQR